MRQVDSLKGWTMVVLPERVIMGLSDSWSRYEMNVGEDDKFSFEHIGFEVLAGCWSLGGAWGSRCY